MSTTRKIEGYLTAHDDNGPGYELGKGAGFGSFWEGDATKFLPDALPVTLIIGGNGYTVDEVKAMAEDIKIIAAEHSSKCYTNRIEQMTPPAPVAFLIDNYLWKTHGIKLP